MPANTQPIYTLTPNVSSIIIPTANAQVKSDGTSAGAGADLMYKVGTMGVNGTLVDRIRFFVVASAAAVNSVATTLRAYRSTVAAPGATTPTDTWLIGEISVPIISASNSTNSTSYYDLVLGYAIQAGQYIHVSQHIAQTANQFWLATMIGGDY